MQSVATLRQLSDYPGTLSEIGLEQVSEFIGIRNYYPFWTTRKFYPPSSATFAGDLVFETIYIRFYGTEFAFFRVMWFQKPNSNLIAADAATGESPWRPTRATSARLTQLFKSPKRGFDSLHPLQLSGPATYVKNTQKVTTTVTTIRLL